MDAAATLPPLARPSREVALDYAERLFLANERVDMQSLAAALGVGRTTLYRWVGDREQLLGEVLARLTAVVWEQVAAEADGEGLERALDTMRRFVVRTASFPPLAEFARREPGLALRVLMLPDGKVADALRAGVTTALHANLPDDVDRLTPDVVDVLVQVGTALEWAPVIIGEPPAVDRAVDLGRVVLQGSLGR